MTQRRYDVRTGAIFLLRCLLCHFALCWRMHACTHLDLSLCPIITLNNGTTHPKKVV